MSGLFKQNLITVLRETPSDDVVLQLFGKVNVEGGKTVGVAMQWRTQEFFFSWGGGSTNSVEDREDGDLGVVAP